MSARISPFSWIFHGGGRLAAGLLGGAYGQMEGAEQGLPAISRVAVGGDEGVHLVLHRWPAGTDPAPGPPVLLLHGLNNNPWCWARVARVLGGERPLFAPASRGHGGSTAPARGYSLEKTTADTLGLLDALGLDQVDLVGHSWGGKIACHLAASAPARVRTLALCDPVPPMGFNALLRRFPGFVPLVLAPERGPYADEAAWQRAAELLTYLRVGDETDRRLWAAGFERRADGSYHHLLPESGYAELVEEVLPGDISPLMERVRCPALLLRPSFTVSFVPGELRPLSRLLPQLQVRRVPGDHAFIHTNPLDTARELRAFWQEASGEEDPR